MDPQDGLEDLRQLGAMLLAPLDATAEGILLLDTEGRARWFNRRFAEMWRFDPAVVRTSTREDLIPRMSEQMLDPAAYTRRVRQIIASEEPEAHDVLMLTQNRVFERRSSIHVVDGVRVGRLLVYRDVTREHRTKAALEHSEARFYDVIAASPDGIVFSRKWTIDYANDAFASALGYDAKELWGRPLLDLLSPEDRQDVQATATSIMAQHRGPSKRERRFLHKSGDSRFFDVAAIRIEIEGLPMMVLFLRETTERRRMESQLAVADRMASIGQLAAGIAHEINNPLGYVLANFDLMAKKLVALEHLEEPELRAQLDELRKMQRLAKEGCEHIKVIVHDLATLARPSDESHRVVDVRWTLETSLNLARAMMTNRTTVITDYGETPLVHANDARLAQVFLNLLRNAAQAIPEGDPEGNVIRVSSRTDDVGRAVVTISDTGCGIAPGDWERIFDPFFTTKSPREGTGLGLSICHSIVTSLGGKIWAEAQRPRGTTFHIVLPARVESAVSE